MTLPLNDLRSALARSQLLVVVGSGVSANATGGASTATWKGLVNDAIDTCVALGARDSVWAARAKEDVESPYDSDLIAAAEKATDGLGGRTSTAYREWLQRAVGGLNVTDTTVTAALAELGEAGAVITTTNYDDCLEDATGWPPVTWRDAGRVQKVLRGDLRAVIHLHGHWAEPESVVFGSSSYADVLRDEAAGTFLRSCLYTTTALFVGFGAGLSDPNFRGLRQWMRRALTASEYRHYRLCRDSDVAAIQMEHAADEAIVAVGYGSDYADLVPYLASLTVGTSGAGFRSIVGPPSASTTRPAALESSHSIALVRRDPDPADVRDLAVAVARFAELQALSDGADGPQADAARRFLFLFEDEIEAVVNVQTRVVEASSEQTAHAAKWARQLLTILDGSGASEG